MTEQEWDAASDDFRASVLRHLPIRLLKGSDGDLVDAILRYVPVPVLRSLAEKSEDEDVTEFFASCTFSSLDGFIRNYITHHVPNGVSR